MNVLSCAMLLGCLLHLALAPASAAGQSPTAKPAPAAAQPASGAAEPARVADSDVGFSYGLPSDWQYVAPPSAPKATAPIPGVTSSKKGDACVEVVLTAKRGSPASAVVVAALPFACYGQTMKARDLAKFGDGAAEGLKQAFNISQPVQGNYLLGSHAMWIERAKGTPKGHAGNSFIFETACTVLAKGAVCWMTMAADSASLRAFEKAPVTLDGESAVELVPAHAFLHDAK